MASWSSMTESPGQRPCTQGSDPQSSTDQDIIAVGDFRMDLRNRQATVRGQELHLNPEEFEMLVFMIGHPKSIITPHTRLTTRWSSTQVRQAEFLRVMAQLRKKLEAVDGCSHYIRTEPWVVYRFDPHNRNDVH